MKKLIFIVILLLISTSAFAGQKTFGELQNFEESDLQNERVEVISMFKVGTRPNIIGKVFYVCVDGVKIFNFIPRNEDISSSTIIPGGCNDTTQPIIEPEVIIKEVIKEVQVPVKQDRW